MGTYHTGVYVRYIPDTKRIVQHMYVLPWYIQARRLLLFQIRNVLSNMCTYNLGTCYEAYQGKGHTSGIYQLVPGLRETSSLVTTFRNPHPKHRQPPPAQRQKKFLRGLSSPATTIGAPLQRWYVFIFDRWPSPPSPWNMCISKWRDEINIGLIKSSINARSCLRGESDDMD